MGYAHGSYQRVPGAALGVLLRCHRYAPGDHRHPGIPVPLQTKKKTLRLQK